eukprot:gene8831-11329_t
MPYENFVAGVDPGLQAWLRMRLAAREVRERGSNEAEVMKDVPYKYYQPWVVGFFELSDRDVQEILHSSDMQLWKRPMEMLASLPLIIPPVPMNPQDIINANLATLSAVDMEKLVGRIMQERTLLYLETFLSHPQVSINARIGSKKRTLLHIACGHGDVDKVTLLLDHKAKVNVADTEGLTPLHYCVHPAEDLMHSVSIMTLLFNQKASVNLCDRHIRSALHYACILQSEKLVQLLLQKGADLAILDAFQKFPLEYLKTGSIRRSAEKFLYKPARRGQLVRLSARQVASSFISDVFQVVQPKCTTCRHTMGTCTLNKQKNYRLWLYHHGRVRSEYVGSMLPEVKRLSAEILAKAPPR